MNDFFTSGQNDSLEIANFLKDELRYEDLENCLVEPDNGFEPDFKVIIDRQNETFYFVDPAGLAFARIVARTNRTDIKTVTLEDIKLWK